MMNVELIFWVARLNLVRNCFTFMYEYYVQESCCWCLFFDPERTYWWSRWKDKDPQSTNYILFAEQPSVFLKEWTVAYSYHWAISDEKVLQHSKNDITQYISLHPQQWRNWWVRVSVRENWFILRWAHVTLHITIWRVGHHHQSQYAERVQFHEKPNCKH